MAITSNQDLVITYDFNQLVTSARILAPSASDAKEHAAQCLMVELIRGILSTGITVEEWNNMPQSEFDLWWAERQTEAWNRAKLNVAASAVPGLVLAERVDAAAVANSMFELGYVAFMEGIMQANRETFTKIGGL